MNEICRKLLDDLTSMALDIIPDVKDNKNFKKNPDCPLEHQPEWHQFGIVTHTKKFVQFCQTEAAGYLKKWGVYAQFSNHLAETIDGKSKFDLLMTSIPLHDIGKFDRDFIWNDGISKADYSGHEEKSKKLILENPKICNKLRIYGLNKSQVKYIASCAGNHYRLGILRNEAKESRLGYTIKFVDSIQCQKACDEVAQKYPEFCIEIGILFLCDSLAKTDIKINAKTDLQIERKTQYAVKKIQKAGLNQALLAAVKQRPVNIALARRFLQHVTVT